MIGLRLHVIYNSVLMNISKNSRPYALRKPEPVYKGLGRCKPKNRAWQNGSGFANSIVDRFQSFLANCGDLTDLIMCSHFVPIDRCFCLAGT